jgi:hypothetical protein
MFGWSRVKLILMLFVIFMPLSPNMQLAHVNKHCMRICAITKFDVFVACTNLTKDDIINYCTWYGIGCGGFKTMFMDLKYLEDDDGSLEDEGYK